MVVAAVATIVVPESAVAQEGWVTAVVSDEEEYAALKEQNRVLEHRIDSLSMLIDDRRAEIRGNDNVEEVEAIRDQILQLEQERFRHIAARGEVAREIVRLEQLAVLRGLSSQDTDTQPSEEVEPSASDTTRHTRRYLLDNDIFLNSLEPYILDELREAQHNERNIETLAAHYRERYDSLERIVKAYHEAESEEVAIPLFDNFNAVAHEADSLSNAIEEMWASIIDSKLFAYNLLLDNQGYGDIADMASKDYQEVRAECVDKAGDYASDALMRYAIGRRALLDFEHLFATTLNLGEAADSLADLRRNIELPDYQLSPIALEERLFLEFAHILFGRTNHYNQSNPIPELKIYERGTIYRLLLGEFRTKQAMSIFKGAQPMFISSNDEGRYLYFAGGYATLEEAELAQRFLKGNGFKNPEICVWEDGVMTNLSRDEKSEAVKKEEDSKSGEETTTIVGRRCMVMITTDTLGEELQAIIERVAPGKRVSRAGNKFVVGAFTERSEAEALLQAIKEFDGDIDVIINEIELS